MEEIESRSHNLSQPEVYPNPALDRISIMYDMDLVKAYKIVDAYGKVVLSGSAPVSDNLRLDIDAGIYYLTLAQFDGTTVSTKFVIVDK